MQLSNLSGALLELKREILTAVAAKRNETIAAADLHAVTLDTEYGAVHRRSTPTTRIQTAVRRATSWLAKRFGSRPLPFLRRHLVQRRRP